MRYLKTSFLLIFVLFPVVAISATTSSITQYGITWTFSDSVTYGQFVNGDYWIVVTGAETLTNVSNSFHSGTDLSTVDYDGTQIDCQRPIRTQGLDNRSANYANNINHELPYTMVAGTSIISAISWLSTDPDLPEDAGDGGRPRLKRIAILTVLSSEPAATSFRPSYAVNQKTIYSTVGLNTAVLGSLAAPATVEDLSSYLAEIQGPLTDMWDGASSEEFRPSDNYNAYGKDATYGIYTAVQMGDALLAAQLDTADVGDKTQLVYALVQAGIDFYGLLQNGSAWPSDGGHQLGYKAPILFAGKLLNSPGMLSIGTDYPQTSNTFQDDSTWYVSEADYYPTREVCSDWSYLPNCSGCTYYRPEVQYNNIDVGTPEWGIRHYDPTGRCRDDVRETAKYRIGNGRSLPGHILAMEIMGLRDEWNAESTFDYYDRSWVIWDGDMYSSFLESMWTTYRNDYPPVWSGALGTNNQYSNTITCASGRFIIKID